ncbi:MAG: bifunctional hydroxymethylpyrimidine kinase/phosphomethylpyrimidine kinase [Muribaculaceae bacterium]|nr:bifunctional hydroxymethylpyrimidine kinase/phosphomethylpyrimidine kinase [Muribaculaceae bacterium]
MNIVLSIAGSDNTGGAGIQADIKTCCAFKTYATTVITGVTSQNSKGVYGVEPVSPAMLNSQIDSIYEVMIPDAVKTGMLPSPEIIEAVAKKLIHYKVRNVVVDPVMVATNGGNLVKPGEDTFNAFREYLIPLATVITPNITEASQFTGEEIGAMTPLKACRLILEKTSARTVLLKGGHADSDEFSIDYLYDGSNLKEYKSARIDTINTHGTGCTLSSAIACGLARGYTLDKAIMSAKAFIHNAIESAKDLHIMNGPGPLDFFV